MQALLRVAAERSSHRDATARRRGRARIRPHAWPARDDRHARRRRRRAGVRRRFRRAHAPRALQRNEEFLGRRGALRARPTDCLRLDEPVADTIESWRDDPWKRRVTVRMLLSLTAGFGFGGLGASVPIYERALAMPLRDEPGSRFTYGGIPLQVFGAFFARKLASAPPNPARVSARTRPRSGRRRHCKLANASGRNPAASDRRVVERGELARVRHASSL